jgi:hypothetical protein
VLLNSGRSRPCSVKIGDYLNGLENGNGEKKYSTVKVEKGFFKQGNFVN